MLKLELEKGPFMEESLDNPVQLITRGASYLYKIILNKESESHSLFIRLSGSIV